MSGIARSRAPARCSRSARSIRPARHLARRAAQRQRARGRRGRSLPARAGASAAIARRRRACRAARSAGSGGRARATSRRWISSARSNSISCSVIAHASASHGAGAAVDAQVRVARAPPADHRVAGEALVERPQVVVDAGGEAHPLDRRLGRRPARPRGPRTARGLRRGLDHRHEHRLLADVQQPHAATRRGGAGARRRSRGRCGTATAASPRRADRPARQPRATGSIAAQQVDVDQERVARDDLAHHALLALAPAGRPRRGGGVTTATVAAPAAKPVAASAAACRAGSGARRAGSSTRVWFATTGRPSTTSTPPRLQATLAVVLVGHARHSMTHRSRRSRRLRVCGRGPEHAVPVRRADAEAALVVLEVVAHVQLAQPCARRACAAGGGARGSGSCRRPGSRPGSRR